MAKFPNFLIIAVLLSAVKCTDVGACLSENPCVCDIDEYNKIDLTQVAQQLKDDEFLEDFDGAGNSVYFRGCKDGTFNATARKLHVNSTNPVFSGSLMIVNTTYVTFNYTNGTFYNTTAFNGVQVGKSAQIKFTAVEGQKSSHQIVYKSGEKVIARIELLCSAYDKSFIKLINAEGTDPTLTFTSRYACVITHHPGMSTGSVFLLIFFISVVVYLVGGCLILYFIRGARGLEMIPNIDFWRSLPGLMKDGIIFLFSGCSPTAITTPETYDRI
ncbi:uncharacterized protein LOC135132039 [Zophobas morio]|uniref:uncharacterized protein LOC135132039 n=1 Tax=Zophobas morio TaxID=2755281 RepID=UPI0030833DE1